MSNTKAQSFLQELNSEYKATRACLEKTCVSGTPLTWNRAATAVRTYKITGTLAGNGSFNANTWSFTGGTSFYYVNDGVRFQN